jgi:hypothetical protein
VKEQKRNYFEIQKKCAILFHVMETKINFQHVLYMIGKNYVDLYGKDVLDREKEEETT